MGEETGYFVLITLILVLWGFIMPFANELGGTEVSINVDEDLSATSASGLSWTDFGSSMLKAFFWYYGDLPTWANLMKLSVNFIWAYLLIRLVRGGG